jgi:hypothetical protein
LTAFLDFPCESPGLFEQGCSFWQAVTATTVSPSRGRYGEFVTLVPTAGDAFLRAQRTGAARAGCHLDVHVDDIEQGTEKALSLGALTAPGGGRLGLRSQGGLAFCVVHDGGEHQRPAPRTWAGGARSLVDQLCIDVPPTAFDVEAGFWAALTGWELRPGSRPEFRYLARPAGMPLRLLLQRLDDAEAGQGRGHPDLACDDVPGECQRHVALGATQLRQMPNWTTLVDSTGLEYCVTRRDPTTGTL